MGLSEKPVKKIKKKEGRCGEDRQGMALRNPLQRVGLERKAMVQAELDDSSMTTQRHGCWRGWVENLVKGVVN